MLKTVSPAAAAVTAAMSSAAVAVTAAADVPSAAVMAAMTVISAAAFDRTVGFCLIKQNTLSVGKCKTGGY